MAASKDALVDSMSKVLATTYLLYVKTQGYHWNVTGPRFNSLHTLFEQQYTELAMAADEIAERIRAIGAFAPGTFSEFRALSDIEEPTGVRDANEMIQNLLGDHESLAGLSRSALRIAEELEDDATADLMTQRIQVHDKTAWMLRSSLG